MLIFYNFNILLATIYIIFGTSILIQCPVLVSVCCMFFVSQNIHIKRSPNAIKIYGELFWNLCDFSKMESTQTWAHRAHNPPGHAWAARHAPVGCAHCGPPFALIPPPKNHINSKIILFKFLSHLDFVWYGFFVIQKTGTGTGHWINRLVQ